jgi:hypothetical protein
MPFAEERKVSGVKLYKGYFLYYILGDTSRDRKIKAHHFNNYEKREVRQFENQFSNTKKYDYRGAIVVRQKNQGLGIMQEKIVSL